MADFSISQSQSQAGLPDISALATQFMQEMFNWGQQQFQQTSALTDQVVGDLMNTYGQLSGIGSQLMNQYSQYFMPEYQNLVQDANSYASRARIEQAMGAAESGVSQSFNAQRQAALADLQSFGIDPSSGRYAALDAAERTQQAAAMAGAGFQAEQATEATGRALRSEALQLGSVMPSQATAAYTAAEGAATAAENAKLANARVGAEIQGTGPQWGSVGQQLHTASSRTISGQGGGGQAKPSQQSSSGSRAAPPGTGGPAGGGGGGNTWDWAHSQNPPPNSDAGGGAGAIPGAKVLGGGGQGGSDTAAGDGQQFGPEGSANAPYGPDTAGQEGSPFFGPATDSANPQMGPDTAGQAGSDYFGPATDSASQSQDTGAAQTGFDQSSYTPYDQYNNTTSGDTFGGAGGTDDSGYAEGGRVVPHDASPSGGRVTDDVAAQLHGTKEPIRLNAGEFIIPTHTVKWLGEKYFQDLIKKSKEARSGAGAKPSLKPPLPEHGAIPMRQ